MYVSTEIITALGSAVAIIAAMLGLAGWGLNRIDHRFDKVDERFEKVDARFEKVDAEFAVIRQEFREELGELKQDLRALDRKVTDLSVAVARIEGPTSRFVVANQ